MAAICWTEVRGQKFTDDEAREASDFHEIVWNFDLSPEMIFDLFQKESLSVAKRLVLAEKASLDGASMMMLSETDERIRGVIQERIKEENLNATGGIHISRA